MNILIAGDFHIPERAKEIPKKLKELAKEVELFLCTGDFTGKEVFEELKNLTKIFVAVKGNCDFLDLPSYAEFHLSGKKVGLIHGDIFGRGNKEKMFEFAREKRLDILISGHTHKHEVWEKEGILFLNPGSATSALSGNLEAFGKTAILVRIEGKEWKVEKITL